MESNNTNSSFLDAILFGLGIAHLGLVWIPSVWLGATALFFIIRLMKLKRPSQINSILVLYSVMVCLSISGPSTYGVFWDVSLIIGAPHICKYYPSGSAGTLAFMIFHTLLSSVIGLTSVLQFMILKYGKRITLKATVIALLAITAASVIIPSAVIFNEYEYIEIRGAHCMPDSDTTQLHLAILLLFGYLPSLVITIAATLITHFKLKKSISDNKKSVIVRSVLAINSFNIVQYNAFRAAAMIVFYAGLSVAHKDDLTMYKLYTVVGRYIADLSYPVTMCSIFIVHKSLRSMLLGWLREMLGVRKIKEKLHLEVTKTSGTCMTMNEQETNA